MTELILAVFLDFVIGDPEGFPHPIRLMGWIIKVEESLARRLFRSSRGLRFAGLLMLIINMMLSLGLVCLILEVLSPYWFYKPVYIYLIFSSLAARNLRDEALRVLEALELGLEEARYRLSFIVGRDTSKLDEAGVLRATVETVAENTSDGVIAPLFYAMIMGPMGAMAYKFINTMDSMMGYKNKEYENLGYFPALFDDLVNYLPARLCSLLMLISSLGSLDVKGGLRILVRDGKNHASPNAGYPEATVAGLLGIQLGGGGCYGGIYVDKPSLGDPIYELNPGHVRTSIGLMFTSELVMILFYSLIRLI